MRMPCGILCGLVALFMALASGCCAPCSDDAVRMTRPRTDLERRFPEIAQRVPHFDARMRSGQSFQVLTELMYFHPRDSRIYPPFLRYLLKESSPRMQWEAIRWLQRHGLAPDVSELPELLAIPALGHVRPRDPASLHRLRMLVVERPDGDPTAGWALIPLGLARDAECLPLARKRLKDKNIFVQFSAAEAMLELGHSKEAIPALQEIAASLNDSSGYYRMAAAERLVRAGNRAYLWSLVQAAEWRQSYSVTVLRDLTGVYFPTAAEYGQWLTEQGIEDTRLRPPRPDAKPHPAGDAG
jgi:HEAT repeat protein